MIYKFKDIIEEVDEFNSELKYGLDDIVGVTIEKGLIPTVANLSQTNLDKFYLVKKNTFVYNPRTHGVRLGMGFNETDKIFITSWNNVAFKVKTEHIVLPKYLWMFFNRPEWDRQSNYLAWGSSTIVFAWKDFLEISIDLPPLEEQRKIVTRYKAIETRISNNKQTIAKLEEAAQALYRKMFVDDVDVENLPEGWRMGTIKEFCKEMKSGGTPSRTNNSYWDSNDIPWLKSGEVHNNVIWNTEDYISESGLKNSSAKLIPADSVIMAMYGATAAQVAYLKCETTTNQACCNMICHSKEDAAYLYFHLLNHQDEIKVLANGGAQENLSQELIANQPIIIGCGSNKFTTIIEQISLLTKENEKLIEMLSLMA